MEQPNNNTGQYGVPERDDRKRKYRTTQTELKECYILEPDSRELHGHEVFEIALREANKASDNRDTCAFVVNLLTLIYPGFKDVLMNRLTELGIRVIHTVKLPSQAQEYMIDYHIEGWTKGHILVIFGCTILVIFKNISQNNYVNFMNKRIQALSAKLGVFPNTEIAIPYSFTKAKAIRSMLGSSMPLKAAVINFVISADRRSHSLENLGGYLFSFLQWSEMSVYKSMFETLIVTDSLVLKDPRVKHEVLNLFDTYNAVRVSAYPQFFRYIGGETARIKLERSRFRILSAVAQKLNPYDRQNSSSLVSTLSEQDKQLVRDLTEIHQRDVSTGRISPPIAKMFSLLPANFVQARY